MNVNKAIALRVSELLLKKNMTQYRLEKSSGLSHSRLGCIMGEKNKTVTLSTVMLLAQGFNMSLIEFLDSPYFDFDNLEIN
ncbi:MAG: helix-turn-helix domain-containing protein [Clostridia bacterium]|nr:helix-turn-helix domain-containing protein [Clostridia bacterium]